MSRYPFAYSETDSVDMIKWCIEFLVNKCSAVSHIYICVCYCIWDVACAIRCASMCAWKPHQYWTHRRENPSVLLWWSIRAYSPKHFSVPAVCSDRNCSQKPTAEGQEAVRSIKLWVNQPIDQSATESVRRPLLAFLSGVNVRPEPLAESLIPARECLTPLTVASGKHTHIYI